MPEPDPTLRDDTADVGEPTLNVTLDPSVIAPECFRSPERCAACADCGLRLLCFERHAEHEPVHLLPRPRFPG